jgi:hypothetical protein
MAPKSQYGIKTILQFILLSFHPSQIVSTWPPFGAFFQNRLMKCSSSRDAAAQASAAAAPDLVVMCFVDETVFEERRLTYMGIDFVLLL